MSMFDLLIFISVVAAVSGLSPTLLGIWTSLLGSIKGGGHNVTKIWLNGLMFIVGFISSIAIIGTAFWLMLDALNTTVATYICLATAGVAIVAGVIEVKDYFWYGRGVSHKPHKRLHSVIHNKTTNNIKPLGSFMLGIVAVAATASNIGLVTIAVASLLFTATTSTNAAWFILFGMLLIVGAFFSLVAFVNGTKISAIVLWKEQAKGAMRLGSGLALIATAWLILLLISHTLTLGQQL